MRKWIVGALVVGLAFALGACAPAATDETTDPGEMKGPITIGSKIDTEGELLSEVIRQLLEADGFEVVDKSQTGTTEVVRSALLNKEIDIYPEYSGSGFWFFEGSDVEVYRDGEKGYEEVKKMDLEANGVVWLSPARANNTWALCVKQDFADAEGVKTMSDFAEWIKAGKPTKVAASDEFFNNADANPAFEEVYGYTITPEQRVTFSGGNTAQTEKAVADGTDGVNFGMAYGTDGALADLGLLVLEDDQGAQLVYWPVPITRTDVTEAYPEIEGILKPAFDALTLEKLQELNARIQVAGEAAEDVAADFLTTGGFLEG